MAVFEDKMSSNDIIINDTMSDDEVVASDVPPRYLFPCTFTDSPSKWIMAAARKLKIREKVEERQIFFFLTRKEEK